MKKTKNKKNIQKKIKLSLEFVMSFFLPERLYLKVFFLHGFETLFKGLFSSWISDLDFIPNIFFKSSLI